MHLRTTTCLGGGLLLVFGALGQLSLGGCATTAADPPEHARSALLFARHCAACHGPRGAADTALVEYLQPPPRDFAAGVFHLVSTANGIPTDADLLRTLERGMPGSTMPSFDWMPEEDLRGLVRFVRHLAVEGRAMQLSADARAAGRTLREADARTRAQAMLRPGPEVELPELDVADDTTLAQGQRLFLTRCAACHGPDGRGFGDETTPMSKSGLAWPRNFAAGVLKGGATPRDLALRVRAGMPAAGMPAIRLSDADTAAVVAFTRSLIPPAHEDRFVQRRLRLRAERVARLPEGGTGGRWQPVPLVLAPLQWRLMPARAIDVAFLHDGRDLAVRLQWDDPRRDDDVTRAPYPDAVALQISADEDPPLLAMGSPDHAVHMWQWQAFPPHAAAGFTDALQPRLDGTRADVPLQPLPVELTVPSTAARAAHGRGIGSAGAFRSADRELAAKASWQDGRWTLVLRRPLAGSNHEDLDLVVGRRVHIACAVWDGSHAEAGARKSITVWHRLELAP